MMTAQSERRTNISGAFGLRQAMLIGCTSALALTLVATSVIGYRAHLPPTILEGYMIFHTLISVIVGWTAMGYLSQRAEVNISGGALSSPVVRLASYLLTCTFVAGAFFTIVLLAVPIGLLSAYIIALHMRSGISFRDSVDDFLMILDNYGLPKPQ